jgi:hypothetical protein
LDFSESLASKLYRKGEMLFKMILTGFVWI